MPLPLKAKLRCIEFITFRRCDNRIFFSYIRFAIGCNRLPTIIFIIYTHYRPTVLPLHRLQMRHTPVWPFVLKMNEPPFTGLCLNKSTLMRTVYLRFSLIENAFHLVRAIYIFGT